MRKRAMVGRGVRTGVVLKRVSDYREASHEAAKEKPLRKSKYTSLAKLEDMLEKIVSAAKPVPELVSGEGTTVLSLDEAMKKIPEKLIEAMSKEEKPKDQFEGSINAGFVSGFAVLVNCDANGKTVSLKVEIPEGTCSKCFVIVEDGVDCCLIEEISGKGIALCSETVLVGNGARVSLMKLHAREGDGLYYQQCIVGKDASIMNTNCWFGGDLVRANTVNILEGSGAGANEFSVLLGSGNQHFDVNYSSVHRAEATESHCIFKSVLKGASSSVFDGMIRIEEGADKSNALLECHSMILGEKASSNQIPGLEIKTDDVKATHSATVSHVDDEELFYIESRGVPIAEARKMVLRSFLESVALRLPKELGERLQKEIEYRA